MAVYTEYTWVFVLSIFAAFVAAFGIGANDLANSFGSSVGSKALQMWQAVIIAGVCEFLGAFFLGASVTDTIKTGITKVTYFKDMPDVFLYGMFCVMISAAFWDNFACHLEYPVSTTHTTVGAVMGFSLVAGGIDAVVWSASKDSFPYYSGFTAVISSWVVSPVCSGIAVTIVYGIVRTCILRRKQSFTIALWALPLFVGATFGLVTGFIIQTGEKNKTWDDMSDGKVAWISVTVAAGTALLTLMLVMPWLRKKAVRDEQRLAERMQAMMTQQQAVKGAAADEKKAKDVESGTPTDDSNGIDSVTAKDGTVDATVVDPALYAKAMYDIDAANADDSEWAKKIAVYYHKALETKTGRAVFQNPVSKALGHSLFYNVHDVVQEDSTVAAVWENAEVFDFKTERLFRYLQVFSAMAMSFAHGSNDVANAMGPFSAVYYTWQNSEVPSKKTPVPEWVLAVGGIGIVMGLATYGYKIMRVLGVKAVKLTNSRGFVVEWCTALVVMISSRFGLPVSTTQVCYGAIIVMGMFEGKKGVNWKLAVKILFGWVITIFIACGVAAFFTAVSIYSPNKNSTMDILDASNTINTQTYSQLQQLNSTALSSNDATLLGQVSGLNSTLNQLWSVSVRDIEATADLQVDTFGLFNSTTCASNL